MTPRARNGTPGRDRRYYLTHRNKILAQKKEYQAANATRIRLRKKAAYTLNRERILADKKRGQQVNSTQIAASKRAHYAVNRQRLLCAARVNWESYKALRNPARRISSLSDEQKRGLHKTRRQYYAKRREHFRAGQRRFRKEHPDKIKAYNFKRKDAMRQQAKKRRAILSGAVIGDGKVIIQWENRWKSKRRVRCFWCLQKFSPSHCHTDHIIPLAKGGAHSVENLCISCESCNVKKNAKLPDSWNQDIAQPVLVLDPFIERGRAKPSLVEK